MSVQHHEEDQQARLPLNQTQQAKMRQVNLQKLHELNESLNQADVDPFGPSTSDLAHGQALLLPDVFAIRSNGGNEWQHTETAESSPAKIAQQSKYSVDGLGGKAASK